MMVPLPALPTLFRTTPDPISSMPPISAVPSSRAISLWMSYCCLAVLFPYPHQADTSAVPSDSPAVLAFSIASPELSPLFPSSTGNSATLAFLSLISLCPLFISAPVSYLPAVPKLKIGRGWRHMRHTVSGVRNNGYRFRESRCHPVTDLIKGYVVMYVPRGNDNPCLSQAVWAL